MIRLPNMAAALLAAATMAWPAHASGCDDPFVGVWQLDLANSKFTASAGVRNKTLIFSKVAAGMLITETVVTDEGETAVYRIPFTYGGGFATQDANPAYDALAVERLDARTLVSTLKFRGAVVGKAKQKISADGKSMEFTSELTLQSGAVARQESLFRRM